MALLDEKFEIFYADVTVTIMSFTIEEIHAEAKRQLKLQAEQEETQKRLLANVALQEALAKEERLRNERLRLLAEEDQVRELARRLMIEAEAKGVVDAKERAIQKEMERLRSRTPLEILEDKVRELQESISTAPVVPSKPPPVEDNLVKSLQERVTLLESFLLDLVQADIHYTRQPGHGGSRDGIKLFMRRYKEERGIDYSSKKFIIDVHLQSDERKEWTQHFITMGSTDPHVTITPDFTTNSIRFYKQTGQWPHQTIGLIPFKILGLTNTSKNYKLIVRLTEEGIEITNEKGEGDSFRWAWGFPIEEIYPYSYSYRHPDCSICEVYE